MKSLCNKAIQNAIDATLIQVWCDFEKGRIKLPKKPHPFDNKVQNILKSYALEISFERIGIIDGSDDAWWEFKIEDKGTGISLLDLNYMQKVAGSSRNIERQKIINRMPIWMRPSGQFGIGLHSAFLLLKDINEEDQKITIISTNSVDYKTYKIELNSPLKSKKGYCFIEEQKEIKKDIGTTLILRLKKKRRARSYSYNNSELYKFLYTKHDPLKEEMFDVFNIATQVENIKDEVLRNICLPYEFNEEWQVKINSVFPQQKNTIDNIIWVDKYSLYLIVDEIKISNLNELHSRLDGGFKGQNVGRISYYNQIFGFYLMFFGLEGLCCTKIS